MSSPEPSVTSRAGAIGCCAACAARLCIDKVPRIAAWRWHEGIFRDNRDREMMLASLAETVEKTGLQVHVWVWMSNHSHLLVERPEANLMKGMAWFQTTGTTRFHARNDLRGSGAPFSVLGARFLVLTTGD